jgi:hypothetical protein
VDHRPLRGKRFGGRYRLSGPFGPQWPAVRIAAGILLCFEQTDRHQPCVWNEQPVRDARRQPRVSRDSCHLRSVTVFVQY